MSESLEERVTKKIIAYAIHVMFPLGKPTKAGETVIGNLYQRTARELRRRLIELAGRGYRKYVFMFNGEPICSVPIDEDAFDEEVGEVRSYLSMLVRSFHEKLDSYYASIVAEDDLGSITIVSGQQLFELVKSAVLDVVLSDPSILLDAGFIEEHNKVRTAAVLLVSVARRVEIALNYFHVACVSSFKCGRKEIRWLLKTHEVLDEVWEDLDRIKNLMSPYLSVEDVVRGRRTLVEVHGKLSRLVEGVRKYVDRKFPRSSPEYRQIVSVLSGCDRLPYVAELLDL